MTLAAHTRAHTQTDTDTRDPRPPPPEPSHPVPPHSPPILSGGRYLLLPAHLPRLLYQVIRASYVNPILINIHVYQHAEGPTSRGVDPRLTFSSPLTHNCLVTREQASRRGAPARRELGSRRNLTPGRRRLNRREITSMGVVRATRRFDDHSRSALLQTCLTYRRNSSVFDDRYSGGIYAGKITTASKSNRAKLGTTEPLYLALSIRKSNNSALSPSLVVESSTNYSASTRNGSSYGGRFRRYRLADNKNRVLSGRNPTPAQ